MTSSWEDQVELLIWKVFGQIARSYAETITFHKDCCHKMSAVETHRDLNSIERVKSCDSNAHY